MVSQCLDSRQVTEQMIDLGPVQKRKDVRSLKGAYCEIRRDASWLARISHSPGPGTSGTETR